MKTKEEYGRNLYAINKLVAIKFIGTKKQKLTAIKFLRMDASQQIWLFKCECGGIKEKKKSAFLLSTTNNCGCKHGKAKHGGSIRDRKGLQKLIYATWVRMRSRCNTTTNPDYHYYGGRGIKVCERWNNFENFRKDMGDRPEGMTLDRIDTNGDYSPENCKWSSRLEQANNRRICRKITHKGKTQTISAWVNEIPIKISRGELYKRIFTRKWEIERAFTQEARHHHD